MVDEHEFHHAFTGFLDHGGIGLDHHAIARGHRAGCNRLGRTFHFDQTHPAVARNRQALVITETRHFFARRFTGLQDGGTVFDFDFNTING